MSNTDPSQFQRIADYKRSWSNNPFLNAQGLEVEEIGTGEVVVRLPQVLPSQRGGGGTDHALNGGVVSYMFDGALGWAIISSLLAMPEALEIDPFELRLRTPAKDHRRTEGDQEAECGNNGEGEDLGPE